MYSSEPDISLFCKLKFHYCVRNSCSLDPILWPGESSPGPHTLTTFKIHFNNIIPHKVSHHTCFISHARIHPTHIFLLHFIRVQVLDDKRIYFMVLNSNGC